MLHPWKCELFQPQLGFQVHLLSLQASVENIASVHTFTHHGCGFMPCGADTVLLTVVQGNILVSFLLWTKDYQELLYCSGFPCDSSLQISSLLSSYGTRRKQILISTLSDSEDLWRGFPKTFHGNFHYPFSCLLVLSRETFGNNKHG